MCFGFQFRNIQAKVLNAAHRRPQLIYIMFSPKLHTDSWQNLCTVKKYLSAQSPAPVANFFLTAVSSSWCITCELYIFSKWWVLRWQSYSVCDILWSWASWRERGGGGSACLLWFTVSRVPVSRQAWSSGSCTPALAHTSAWQAKLLKGRTGARRPRLARLTHETKTQCYRPASASLWCQSVLLIRKSLEGYLLCLYHLSRLPPHLLYVVVGADNC